MTVNEVQNKGTFKAFDVVLDKSMAMVLMDTLDYVLFYCNRCQQASVRVSVNGQLSSSTCII